MAVQLDVRITRDLPEGTVRAASGELIPFCGWLGLLAALAAVAETEIEKEDYRRWPDDSSDAS